MGKVEKVFNFTFGSILVLIGVSLVVWSVHFLVPGILRPANEYEFSASFVPGDMVKAVSIGFEVVVFLIGSILAFFGLGKNKIKTIYLVAMIALLTVVHYFIFNR